MHPEESLAIFRPAVSKSDWKKICAAIKAYSHNSEYRDLLTRLERQAKLNGIATPTK